MSNANRDYIIVYDVKNSSLVLSRPLRFYITDKNTSNIFIKLVTRVIVGNGIDQYTDIENASNYVLTMRVIKPNNEVKSLEATQHEEGSVFQFDLTEDFKDIPGKYICELTIGTMVNSRQELITSDPFSYEVKRSILSNVGEIIETEDTTVEKLLNNLDATKAELSSQIKEKANQSDLEVEKARIDSLTILAEGSTTGDAELIDGRIGYDTTKYTNIGTAVRTQVKNIEKVVRNIQQSFDLYDYTHRNGFLELIGGELKYSDVDNFHSKTTGKIRCKGGDIFSYNGVGKNNALSYVLFKGKQIVSTGQIAGQGTVTIPSGINYVLFSSYAKKETDVELLVKSNYSNKPNLTTFAIDEINNDINDINNDINDIKSTYNQIIYYKNLFDKTDVTTGFIDKQNSIQSGNYYTSNYIKIYNGEKYTISPACRIIAFYDINKNFISKLYDGVEKTSTYTFKSTINGYIRISIRSSQLNLTMVEQSDTASDYSDYGLALRNEVVFNNSQINKIKSLTSEDVLYNKKWAVIGDSFTAGDFTGYTDKNGLSGTDSPVLYDRENAMYKTYPWWIMKRNNMTLQKFYRGGKTLATPADGVFTNSITYKDAYKKIDADVDYITIYLGINDSHHRPNSTGSDGEDTTGVIPLGTATDTTINTFYGAWNVMLKDLITLYPYAHIGILVSNGCETGDYANATIEMAKKWGIPYLNLDGGYDVPLLHRTQTRSETCDEAKNIRLSQFRVSTTNGHPNIKAHEYESTFIENFLRSL